MKLSINKNLLAQTTSIIQRAASTKDALPALSGMLLTAREDKLILQATDMDIGIKITLSAVNIFDEGEVLVNAKYFNDLVRYLSDEEIILEYDSETGKLNIFYGPSSTALNLYNPEEFSEIPLDKIIPIGSIPQTILRNYIKKTSFAAANTHFKPVFTGILFDFSDEFFNIVASDTHRLAIIKSNHMQGVELKGHYIVPVRTLTEIARIIEETEKEISIGLAENHIVFYVEEDNFYCTSRLIEGQYPNYQNVIPSELANTFAIESDMLSRTLDRAALLPIDPKSIQSIKISFHPDELVITAFSEKMGELIEVINNVEAANDKSFDVSFNTKYLSDIVKVLSNETKTIQIGLNGPLSPAIIKNPDDENYTYVLVPLRMG